jgi:hypothetical protein
MERATNDRFVWTDDDFDRGADWLDRLVAAGERRGPATVVPAFVGGGWWRPVEPVALISATATVHFGVGTWGGNAWGGGVTFSREDLDVPALVADLRRSLSDDGVLSRHLGHTHPVRSMRATVRVPGEFHAVKERMVRLARIPHVYEGFGTRFLVSLVVAALALLFPLRAAAVATAVAAATYAVLGFRRWTFLLAYPAVLLMPVVFGSGIVLREFEWAGRRYRLDDAGEVEVLGRVGEG